MQNIIENIEKLDMSRFTQLRRYHEKKFYTGRYIRWLIEDSEGSVYCDKCGNIANGVMEIKRSMGSFNIPLCRVHFAKNFPDAEYLPIKKQLVEGRKITPKQKREEIKQRALSKLTDEEKEALNL
jgi:hypothetical protein